MERSWARLGDRQAIRDVLARYWRGIDRADPNLVLGTYHPGAYDDHGYFKGPVEGFVETLGPGVWSYFPTTQHFAGNLQIDFRSEDRARAESYALAHHVRPGESGQGDRDLVYGLRYVDDFERRDGEWRIARRVCAWDWHRIDPVGGIALPASYFRGHRSPRDPVYGHPLAQGRRVPPDALVAKRACLDALHRYARGVDRCDLELVRSAYHPDACDDHGGYQGDVDGFLAWLKATVFDAFACTMHMLGNVLIEVEGERAWGETYAVAHHVAGTGEDATDLVMGVRYLDRFERRGGEWKIADRQMSFEWERAGAIGSQRAYPGFAQGRRDGGDPVLLEDPGGAAIRPIATRVSIASAGEPDAAAATALEELADREAIHRQLVRYCRGVDRRDFELIRAAYHPDAWDDHGSYQGDVEGFLAFVRDEVHARFRTTMHKLGQSRIELSGDVARVESYAICHHVAAEPVEGGAPGATRDVADLVMGIRYLDRFERRAGEWRIARRQLVWEWVRTDRLEPLDPAWTPGQSGPLDPVFAGIADPG